MHNIQDTINVVDTIHRVFLVYDEGDHKGGKVLFSKYVICVYLGW